VRSKSKTSIKERKNIEMARIALGSRNKKPPQTNFIIKKPKMVWIIQKSMAVLSKLKAQFKKSLLKKEIKEIIPARTKK
jgi:hypothetical protein